MMARLIFLISLVLAYVSLHGWPGVSNTWLRALIALTSMLTGYGAIVLRANHSKAGQFRTAGKPAALDRWVRGLGIALALGWFYCILAFGPQIGRQLSDSLFARLRNHPEDPGLSPQEIAMVPSHERRQQQTNPFEIGTLFDPAGAVVPKTASLIASDDPQVSVKTSSAAAARLLRDSGAVYLHAFSLHAFDGERWTTHGPAVPQKLTPDADGFIRLQDPDQAAEYEYTIIQHREHAAGTTLNALHGVRFVRLPEVDQLNPGTWVLPPGHSNISEYQAGSSPRLLEHVIASGAEIVPGDAEPGDLAPTTDPGLKLQIMDLSARFRNDAPLGIRLMELQRWLSDSFTYSLQVDYPDPGKSAIENFLTNPESKEGFCVHFASAAVLLLRDLGVPARISYGWSGGEFYEGHNQFVFRGDHAHAWAEICLRDHGWVVFDATPASAQPQCDSAPPGAIPPAAAGTPAGPDTVSPLVADSAATWKWALAMLGAGACLLCLLLGLKLRRVERRGVVRTSETIGAAPAYLQLFQQACRRKGHPKPAGRTLSQHLGYLGRQGICIPFASELLAYHYNVTYRGLPRDASLEKRLCDQIKAL